MRQVYLDYNATTPIAPSVYEAMIPYQTQHYVNPSSHHAQGRICRQAIEDAREQVATLLGAQPDEVYFTSGGTESNNLVLRGTGRQRVVVSAGEHDSVLRAAGDAEQRNAQHAEEFRVEPRACLAMLATPFP